MPRTAPHPACGARRRTKRGAFICGESHAPSPFSPRAGRRWRQPDEGLLQAFAGAALKKEPSLACRPSPPQGGRRHAATARAFVGIERLARLLQVRSWTWNERPAPSLLPPCGGDGRQTREGLSCSFPQEPRLAGENGEQNKGHVACPPPYPHPKNIIPRTPARSRTRPACCSSPRSVQPLPATASCPSASRSSRRSCRGRSQGRRRGRRGR
ncbi:hypothetical protein C8J35_101458 [Rhizobium sp. PP-F2F-G38]|nr:hypothetical protein C8J37_101459 [Rhizobium sp. PP-WC-1G-195]PYF00641.1 hypothetical protein C8J35_101458 [Rhizobium sp. PP-F2F-G38]